VLSGKTVVAVSAAGGHSFALCSDGIMAAWGRNVEGQLGNGSNGSNNRSIVPALVTQSGVLSGKTVVAVSAGSSHSLALCSDGTIAAWGNNQAGKLGNNNSTTSSSVPVLVTQSGVLSGKTLVAVSAGSGHSLALSSYDESTAGLSDFTLSSGSYNPIFDTATTAYSADVSYTTSSITILPTALVENLSVLKVNGSIVASGSNSQPIPLVVGANVITCVVTAPDGITTKTYTVMVNRAPSAGSSLSALTLSSGTLTPNFSSNTTSYTASVTNATSSITVMPTLTTTTATVRVNGTPVTSGSNSQSIPLSVGANTITVVGTAQDGTTTSTYTVTVTRAPLTVSTLSALTLSNGSLSPGFVSSTTTYTASVANATSSITVRPTLTTTTATVRVNGTLVTSGSNSQSIPLSVGANTITVVGIAQDGTTTSTYTVTVVREVSGYASWQDDVFTSEEQANPSMSDEQASPAGDGISNLMKYAMKLDPKSSGVANLPRSSARDGHLTLTFRRNKLASDLTYTVQVTSDLTSAEWQDAGVVISQTDEGEFWMVTVRDDEPMHNHSKRFMRLKVSK
jgi:hypothetical protein